MAKLDNSPSSEPLIPILRRPSAPWQPPRSDAPQSTRGLLLVGHGSTKTDEPHRQLTRLATTIRGRGRFNEVAASLVRGGMPVDETLREMTSETVFVAPVLMAEGFIMQAGIRDKICEALRMMRAAGAERQPSVHISPPLGLHPMLAEIIAANAIASFGRRAVNPVDGNVLLIAHGTPRNPGSERATAMQAKYIASLGVFEAVKVAFLEQAPLLTDVLPTLTGPTAAVGMFAASGMHAGAEVTAMIADTGNADIAYLGPIGEDPRIADVTLDLVGSYRRGPRSLGFRGIAAGAPSV